MTQEQNLETQRLSSGEVRYRRALECYISREKLTALMPEVVKAARKTTYERRQDSLGFSQYISECLDVHELPIFVDIRGMRGDLYGRKRKGILTFVGFFCKREEASDFDFKGKEDYSKVKLAFPTVDDWFEAMKKTSTTFMKMGMTSRSIDKGCPITEKDIFDDESNFCSRVKEVGEMEKNEYHEDKHRICPLVKHAVGLRGSGPHNFNEAVFNYRLNRPNARQCKYKTDVMCSDS